MRKLNTKILMICVIFIISVLFAACDGGNENEDAAVRKTNLNIPEENFIVTDMEYSKEKGLQVAGYRNSSDQAMTVSVWNYTDDEKWEMEFKKEFSCGENQAIEGQIYWSSNGGFLIPYTYELDNPASIKDLELKNEYYYINKRGTVKKISQDGIDGIDNPVFVGEDKLYWRNWLDFTLIEWNPKQNSAPQKVKLSAVQKVHRIAYAGDYLYVLGSAEDVALYNVKNGEEEQGSANLEQMAKDLMEAGLAANEFAFTVYIDENKKETLYYVDYTGLWKYRDGEKEELISGSTADFDEETYFTNMAVKDENTVFIDLFTSREGLNYTETLKYDLNQ